MAWWRDAVFYQIYPRSFQDSNDDGIGDLPGVILRLDYLIDVGVDAIWLNPFYPSPQKDFGYDISDYTDVDPVYGTLGNFDRLIAEAHRRGLRVIIDLVPNHTSDEHPWFKQSRSSRAAPRRNWYIWRDPAPDGGPPNNWLSMFGGSAWTLDRGTGQYYLHTFLPEQVDLNWRNPEVAGAIHDVMRFWLDRGVDGFRVDAIHQAIKSDRYQDNPPNPDYRVPPESPRYNPFLAQRQIHNAMQPEVFEIVRGLRSVVEEYDEAVLVGEIGVFDQAQLVRFLGQDLFHLGFDFNLYYARTLEHIRDAVGSMNEIFPQAVWPTLAFSSHDVARLASRLFRGDRYDGRRVRLAALLLLTLRGTPFLYYGEELGMPNAPVPDDLLQDPVGIFERDGAYSLPSSLNINGYGRDPERTPMLWNSERYGGFSRAEPWLTMGDGSVCHVERQQTDPDSQWSWVQCLLTLRRGSSALKSGDFRSLTAPEGVWAYSRRARDEQVVVIANLSNRSVRDLGSLLDSWGIASVQTLAHSRPSGDAAAAGSKDEDLQPYEGVAFVVRELRPSRRLSGDLYLSRSRNC